jgi:hypothetical protein
MLTGAGPGTPTSRAASVNDVNAAVTMTSLDIGEGAAGAAAAGPEPGVDSSSVNGGRSMLTRGGESVSGTQGAVGVGVDVGDATTRTPPPPSARGTSSRTGVKAVGQGPYNGNESSPAAGSFVESPILIATRSLTGPLFNEYMPPAAGAGAGAGGPRDDNIRGILTTSGRPSALQSIASVSGVDPLPAAYVEGGDGLGVQKPLVRITVLTSHVHVCE